MNLKENISNLSIWVRLLWMGVYLAILYILCFPALMVIILFQFSSFLLTGNINQNLNKGAKYVAKYITDIIMYLSYVSEEKPYPLNNADSEIVDVEDNTPKKSGAKTQTPKATTKKNAT